MKHKDPPEDVNQWVVSRLSDIAQMQRNLKERVSEMEQRHGVVPSDNGDHLMENLEEELSEMEQRLIEELSSERTAYLAFLSGITEDSRQLAAFVVVVVVITLALIALAREGIDIPGLTTQYTFIAFAPSTIRYSLGLRQGIPQPNEAQNTEKEERGWRQLPTRP